MIYSHSIKLDNSVMVPQLDGKISMMPFKLNDLEAVPLRYIHLVKQMIKKLPYLEGKAYLTIHGKKLVKYETHRRPGPHIDGNFLENVSDWGGNGWKVGDDGLSLSPEDHKRSYEAHTGGMLLISNYPTCIGWNGIYLGDPGIGGDCSHIKELSNKENFLLDADTIYYGTSQFIHKSVPVNVNVHRTFVRITLPETYPWLIPNP